MPSAAIHPRRRPRAISPRWPRHRRRHPIRRASPTASPCRSPTRPSTRPHTPHQHTQPAPCCRHVAALQALHRGSQCASGPCRRACTTTQISPPALQQPRAPTDTTTRQWRWMFGERAVPEWLPVPCQREMQAGETRTANQPRWLL